MTKEQIVSWISQYPFYASLVVIAFGLILGFLIAWLFWGRRHRAWRLASQRNKELASEAKGYESRNRYFSSLAAERQKLAAEMDWSQFDFISPALAVKLKELGATDLENLHSLSPSQRVALDSEFTADGLSMNWKAVDQAQASLDLAKSVDVDWNTVEGVDSQTAAELKGMGIKNFGELESMSPAERIKFEAELKRKGVSWDWSKLGSWKTAVDQRSDLKGPHFGRSDVRVKDFAAAVEGKSESALSANQSSASGRSTVGAAASEIVGAGLGVAGSTGSINLDEVVARDFQSTEPPRLFESTPQWKDDLTLLDGIGDLQSRELRKMGIYNFDQLHNLPHLEQARLQAWFHSKGWHLDMDQWRISSEGNTLNPSMESIQKKAYEVYCHRRDHDLCGDQGTDWEQAEWSLRGNPIWGYGVPHDVEDYAQSMEGITEEARNELYRMGLYNRHQVELLNEQERRLLTSWFAGPRFGVDLTKAFGWLSTLKPAPSDLNFGELCDFEPVQIDDLSRINGIGNATESDLNRLGIYHFSQIADWTPENVAAIAEALGLENRIQQDAWIDQAKQLLQSGQ